MDWTNAGKLLLEIWTKGGNFCAGVVVGCFIFHHAVKLASADRIERQKLDLEREKELRSQLNLKEQRIDELHKRLNGTKTKR